MLFVSCRWSFFASSAESLPSLPSYSAQALACDRLPEYLYFSMASLVMLHALDSIATIGELECDRVPEMNKAKMFKTVCNFELCNSNLN